MINCSVRRMETTELKGFYKHIKRDFSPGEYAPYEVLRRQIAEGVQEALVFRQGAEDLGYAICAAGNSNGYVLISLLAVFQEYRGQGIGTAFINALHSMYTKKQAVIVEVEKPELAETEKERDSRRRRIEFYEREGYYLIPGIDYSIWDVPMHLMALPLLASKEDINEGIGQIMYQIYLQLMGQRFMHKMQFRTL